jgi:EmrB/QacA subfamily drug resistance transporter
LETGTVTAHSRRVAALITASAAFLELKDTNALVVVLPTLASDFGVPALDMSLAITSYVVTLAVFIPVSGWAADRFGARRVFEIALVIFMVGSAFCAMSETLTELVLARILQAFGGSFMTPVGRLILVRSSPREELVSLMAWFGIPILLGPLVSPLVGGALADRASWTWIFWMNLPLGIVILVLTRRLVPWVPKSPRAPLDWLSWAPLLLGFCALMAGVEAIGEDTVHPVAVAILIVGGLSGLAVYTVRARRSTDALIDLRLLRLPSFRLTMTGSLAFSIGTTIRAFLLPMLLQVVYGYDAFTSGVIAVTAVVGALASRLFVGRLVKALTPIPFMVVTALLAALCAISLAFIDARTDLALLVTALVFGGFFQSLQGIGLNAMAYAEVDDVRTGSATSFAGTVQQVGQATGAAFAAILVEMMRNSPNTALTHRDFAVAFIVSGILYAAVSLVYPRIPPIAVSKLVAKKMPDDPG